MRVNTKRMKFIFLSMIGFFYLTFSCSCNTEQGLDYEKIANGITAKTAKKLKEQKQLRLVGTGGAMMNDIQIMCMSFDYYQKVDLEEARELLVYAVSEYLSDINGNTEVRPYLHEYPFTAKNVEMRIWILEPDGNTLPPDKIYYMSAIDGILNYYVRGPEKYSRESVCKETYEEALKILNAKQMMQLQRKP